MSNHEPTVPRKNHLENHYLLLNERDISILSYDINTIEHPFHFDRHVHHMLEISYIKSGKGTYCIGNNKHSACVGDVFVISNSEPHVLHAMRDQHVTNAVVHFEPFLLHDFLNRSPTTLLLDIFFRRIDGLSNRLDADLPFTQRVRDRLIAIEDEFIKGSPYHRLFIRVHLESIFCELLRGYKQPECLDYGNSLQKDLYEIDKVIDYINFNLTKSMTLASLASIAHVSPAYFSSLFKRYMGISLFEYILQRKIQFACQLIMSTSKTMTEISCSCGFNNYTSFFNAFKRFLGCSPTEFRKNPHHFEYVHLGNPPIKC